MNRLVVVSNRVPLPSAGQQAGGLAVALDGLMEKRGGLWFGWSGAVSSGAATSEPKVESAGAVDYATVDLTPEEHERYYNNFSNGMLWPLLHSMSELMKFDRRDARVYRAVNERLAGQLATLLQPGDVIWVHDYHMIPFAAALLERGVKSPIGFFLHIPFASPDMLGSAPEVAGLVRDLLAADLLGFQTDNDMANFAAAAQAFAGAVRISATTLAFNGRRVRLGVFPVEIEAHSFARMAAEMEQSEGCQRLRASLFGQKLILGIDRLDPTKGLMQRLAGYRCLLEKHEDLRRHVTLLQVAAVSRKEVVSYRELRDDLDHEAGGLNADLGEADWTPLRLLSKATVRPAVAGYMRIARVGLVTPLRDGMNLVAKEFVAAQNPADPGVLVLSRFAGAARQLDAALLVNPHDPDAMADALDQALRMGLAERQARWRSLWEAIEHRSPVVWGRSFLASLLRATDTAARLPRQQGVPALPGREVPALPGVRLTLEHADLLPASEKRRLN
jgi:trehalose 6-phosphate synthase